MFIVGPSESDDVVRHVLYTMTGVAVGKLETKQINPYRMSKVAFRVDDRVS